MSNVFAQIFFAYFYPTGNLQKNNTKMCHISFKNHVNMSFQTNMIGCLCILSIALTAKIFVTISEFDKLHENVAKVTKTNEVVKCNMQANVIPKENISTIELKNISPISNVKINGIKSIVQNPVRVNHKASSTKHDSTPRIRGAVVVQAPPRNKGFEGFTVGSWGKRLCLFLHMIRSVDMHLNQAFGTTYPIFVIVSSDPEADPLGDDAIYSIEDRKLIRSWAPASNVSFIDIAMYTGEALSPGIVRKQVNRWAEGRDDGVAGRPLGYRSMCRLWSGRLQMMSFLDDFEYYMRLDDDSFFTKDLDRDPFYVAHQNKLDYIYVRKSPDSFGLAQLKSVASAHGKFKGDGNSSPYTNFHVARVSIFRSDKFKQFWADLEKKHVFMRYRVGDALLHAVIIDLFIPRNKVQTMPKLSYAHNSNDYPNYPPAHWHQNCPLLLPGPQKQNSSSGHKQKIMFSQERLNGNVQWQSIRVFTGSGKLGDPRGSTFSQEGQEILVLALLGCKRHGFFIDIASHTALRLSNTRALERDWGWNGICVEGNSQYWYESVYRKCTLFGSVVSDKNDVNIKFDTRSENGATGGIETGNVPTDVHVKWLQEPTKSSKTFFRRTTTFQNLLLEANAPRQIDYLSLDVEGSENSVMATFPYESTVIKVMSIERPSMALQTQLKSNGYVKLGVLGDFGETVWVHKSIDIGLAAAQNTYEKFKASMHHFAHGMTSKSFSQMIHSQPLSAKFEAKCVNIDESPLIDIIRYRFV